MVAKTHCKTLLSMKINRALQNIDAAYPQPAYSPNPVDHAAGSAERLAFAGMANVATDDDYCDEEYRDCYQGCGGSVMTESDYKKSLGSGQKPAPEQASLTGSAGTAPSSASAAAAATPPIRPPSRLESPTPLHASDTSAQAAELSDTSAPRLDRLALVIGNRAYGGSDNLTPLDNPINDATGMRRALEKAGFEVIYGENLDSEKMEDAIREFRRRLGPETAGLFYFSGHGIQVDGLNFLIPVGAPINSKADVRNRALSADRILEEMEESRSPLKIVVLDACRDSGPPGLKSIARGLAAMQATPKGTIIAFATAAGQAASDGLGNNGIYTKHLLANILRPNVSVLEMFNDVAVAVSNDPEASSTATSSAKNQQPFLQISPIEGKFCFMGC